MLVVGNYCLLIKGKIEVVNCYLFEYCENEFYYFFVWILTENLDPQISLGVIVSMC